MNKVLAGLAVLCFLFTAAGNAVADFTYGANSSLTLSIFNEATNVEVGYDLGLIGVDFTLDQENLNLGTVDVSDLGAGVALYSATSAWQTFVGTTVETAPLISTRNIASQQNACRDIWLNYGDVSPASVAASGLKSANTYFADGSYANFVTGNGGQPALSPLTTESHIDIYLYQYDGGTLNKGLLDPSSDYAAVFRINSDGSVVLNPPPGNRPPTANAGADQTVDENASISLDGSASSDPDGDNITYAWVRKDDEPVTVTLSDETAVNPTFTAPEVGGGGVELIFGLTVTDSADNVSEEDTVTVTVANVNQPPVASAGADLAVDEGETVTLDGSGTSDPDGDDLVYLWEQINIENATVTLSDASVVSPTFTAPPVDADETLYFRLTATDGAGASSSDEMAVTVRFVNQNPVALAAPETQNVIAEETVTLDGSGSHDPDGGDTIATYSWEQVGGSPAVALLPSADSASVSFTAPAVNVTLTFQLTVTDSHGGSHADTCIVNVTMGDNSPPVPHAGEDQTVFERTPVTLDASGTTDDDGDELTYLWEQTGGVPVTLSNDNGIQPTFTSPDVDEEIQLTFQLTVSDAEFVPTDTVTITVWENHAPPAPSVNAPPDGSEVDSPTPTLSVNNAGDDDGHELTFTFELYGDLDLTDLLYQESVADSGGNTTAWQVPGNLTENKTYYWRARASDGIDTSDWMAKAEFLVNASQEAPGVPAVSSPPDGSTVDSINPLLEVTNTTDPDGDALTYEFRLYLNDDATVDDSFLNSPNPVVEESDGTTAWRLAGDLEEDRTYWWRTRATDDTGLAGDWSPMVSFLVNSYNYVPSTPTPQSVADGSDIQNLRPELVAGNADDSDGDPLNYYFEIDTLNTFNSGEEILSAPVAGETDGSTAWQPEDDLDDNTLYYWRVRAHDGQAYSDWALGSFFVNLENDPPSVPQVFSPEDGAAVSTYAPTLVVLPVTDPDDNEEEIAYDYRLYAESDLTTPLAEESGEETTSWTPNGADLQNHRRYLWQARASDGETNSDWSFYSAFTITANNYIPNVPTINQPYDGGTVDTLNPVLGVITPEDEDGDEVNIVFELYGDENLSDYVADHETVQGDATTTWTVEPALTDNTTYYWRARATDGVHNSSWTGTASFRVDLDGDDTEVDITVVQSASVSADSPNDTVVVVDDGGNLDGVQVTIPAGALEENTTIFIGEATRAPSMPEETLGVGAVIEFGPSGLAFNTPVQVRIPYDPEALATAGLDSPDVLRVYTYDETENHWVEIPIASVDTANQVLVCQLEHFSLYAVGAAGSPSIDASGSGGGGGGGCFISAIAGPATAAPGLRPGILAISAALVSACWVCIRNVWLKQL
ncbi:hypothetical protein DSCA_22970 [Desulfosarcina alkanivorans]|uniref:ZU5 domain-containing protein n=1 Tax=Desulfosarcina alkanivorans TaxID=571177 RepID=A0A5K7YUL1_9BACT|nr:PKD domain-containing protein [Desulfosarcina alkanivorans]BBO68367.1 hypothetical protein DSCA_22970 [Desulfosarcina alkanivorans]